MSSKIPYCYQNINGTYYYRAVFPVRFRSHFPALSTSVRFSLQTKSPKEARSFSLYRRVQFDALIVQIGEALERDTLLSIDLVTAWIDQMKKSPPDTYITHYALHLSEEDAVIRSSGRRGERREVADNDQCVSLSDGTTLVMGGEVSLMDTMFAQSILDNDVREKAAPIAPPISVEPRKSVKLSAMSLMYFDKCDVDNPQKAKKDRDAIIRMVNDFIALVGDVDGMSLRSECIEQYRINSRSMPRCKESKLSGLVGLKRLKEAKRLGINPRKLQTTNNQFNAVRSFLVWANSRDFIPSSYKDILVSFKSHHRDDDSNRREWEISELRVLLNSYIYRSDDLAKGELTSGQKIRYAHFWIPLVGLYTGARIEELCSLLSSQIKFEDGVWFFDMPYYDQDGHRIKKNKSSARAVPLHQKLIDFGLVEYAASRREQGENMLFDEPIQNNKYSHTFSKWFGGTYKERLGLPKGDNSITFHSIRNTVISNISKAGVPEELYSRITGHAFGGEGRRTYDGGFRAKDLVEAINKIQYPDIDLSHISFDDFKKRFIKKEMKKITRAKPRARRQKHL